MLDSWIGLSIGAAVSKSLKPPTVRLAGLYRTPPYALAWAASVGALPALGILLMLDGGTPALRQGLVGSLLVAALFGAASLLLQIRAFSIGDVSYIAPFEGAGILFAALGGYYVLGETLSPVGLLGILAILLGSFIVQRTLAPASEASIRNREALLLLLLSHALWGFSVNFEKLGILLTSPLFFAFILNVAIAVLLTPVAWKNRANVLQNNKFRRKRLLAMMALGTISAAIISFQYAAFSLTNISYVLAIKQTGALLSVLLGGLIFREGSITARFLGAGTILTGALIVSLAA